MMKYIAISFACTAAFPFAVYGAGAPSDWYVPNDWKTPTQVAMIYYKSTPYATYLDDKTGEIVWPKDIDVRAKDDAATKNAMAALREAFVAQKEVRQLANTIYSRAVVDLRYDSTKHGLRWKTAKQSDAGGGKDDEEGWAPFDSLTISEPKDSDTIQKYFMYNAFDEERKPIGGTWYGYNPDGHSMDITVTYPNGRATIHGWSTASPGTRYTLGDILALTGSATKTNQSDYVLVRSAEGGSKATLNYVRIGSLKGGTGNIDNVSIVTNEAGNEAVSLAGFHALTNWTESAKASAVSDMIFGNGKGELYIPSRAKDGEKLEWHPLGTYSIDEKTSGLEAMISSNQQGLVKRILQLPDWNSVSNLVAAWERGETSFADILLGAEDVGGSTNFVILVKDLADQTMKYVRMGALPLDTNEFDFVTRAGLDGKLHKYVTLDKWGDISNGYHSVETLMQLTTDKAATSNLVFLAKNIDDNTLEYITLGKLGQLGADDLSVSLIRMVHTKDGEDPGTNEVYSITGFTNAAPRSIVMKADNADAPVAWVGFNTNVFETGTMEIVEREGTLVTNYNFGISFFEWGRGKKAGVLADYLTNSVNKAESEDDEETGVTTNFSLVARMYVSEGTNRNDFTLSYLDIGSLVYTNMNAGATNRVVLDSMSLSILGQPSVDPETGETNKITAQLYNFDAPNLGPKSIVELLCDDTLGTRALNRKYLIPVRYQQGGLNSRLLHYIPLGFLRDTKPIITTDGCTVEFAEKTSPSGAYTNYTDISFVKAQHPTHSTVKANTTVAELIDHDDRSEPIEQYYFVVLYSDGIHSNRVQYMRSGLTKHSGPDERTTEWSNREADTNKISIAGMDNAENFGKYLYNNNGTNLWRSIVVNDNIKADEHSITLPTIIDEDGMKTNRVAKIYGYDNAASGTIPVKMVYQNAGTNVVSIQWVKTNDVASATIMKVDNLSIQTNNADVVMLKNYDTASAGMLPYKGADGNLAWVSTNDLLFAIAKTLPWSYYDGAWHNTRIQYGRRYVTANVGMPTPNADCYVTVQHDMGTPQCSIGTQSRANTDSRTTFYVGHFDENTNMTDAVYHIPVIPVYE